MCVYACVFFSSVESQHKKGNMAKFSRGLQIDFVKQPRTRKSLTNPPLWCQLHKTSLSSAIIEHWADYCCPGVIPSVLSLLTLKVSCHHYSVSNIWAWACYHRVECPDVSTSLCLFHTKVSLPLETWSALMSFVWVDTTALGACLSLIFAAMMEIRGHAIHSIPFHTVISRIITWDSEAEEDWNKCFRLPFSLAASVRLLGSAHVIYKEGQTGKLFPFGPVILSSFPNSREFSGPTFICG